MTQMASQSRLRQLAMTLPEVVISIVIGSLVFGGALLAYIQGTRRAEWSAYYLAGHSMAMQRLEQARAAKWDTQASPPVDQLVASNFPVTVDILDIPISGSNVTYATSVVTITTLSTAPPLKMIVVETTWPFTGGRTFTNTAISYRGPDQ